MKTMLAVMMLLMGVAWSQSTVTTIDKNGQRTSVTASCTNGDCIVWDSTNDPTAKEVRQANHEAYLEKHPEKAKKEREKRERAECKKDHDAHAWCSLYDAKK
jgi:hypothetical protein